MQSFFPLRRSMLERSEKFRQLTCVEKVFYINLLADMNLAIPDGGTFYRADARYAAALNISIQKVRQARVRFKKLGLIEFKPGGYARNRPLATRYTSVRGAKPPKEGEGDQFVKMQRHAFNMVLARLRRGAFKAEDVVCYVYLTWWREKYSQNETFVLFKSQWSRMTRIRDVAGCVRRLYENFEYAGGDHLFKFEDHHQKITVWNLAGPADPSEDKNSAEIAERWLREVDEKAKCLSQEGKKDWSERQQKRKPSEEEKQTLPF